MADELVRRVPSVEFRKSYPSLEEPVAVTVLGRVIGWYSPVPRPAQDGELSGRTGAPVLRGVDAPFSPSVASHSAAPGRTSQSTGSMTGMTQAGRDKVLRRMATKERG